MTNVYVVTSQAYIYPVQLVVETTRVADGTSVGSATPQRGLRRVAVGTTHASADDHSLPQTPS